MRTHRDLAAPCSSGQHRQGEQPAPRDLQHLFVLVLATIWLFDAVLQLQPFMFTPGPKGFGGMLASMGSANHGWVAHSISWNASIVSHHVVATNTLFALVQFLIAFGIIWSPTRKIALGASVVWALFVWWFGEGLGMILVGGATPFAGGPGAILFYALLAILLWPSEGHDQPFVAARSVGSRPAKAIWVVLWVVLAILAVTGQGRSPEALHSVVANLSEGQPGWLSSLDRHTAALLLHHGTTLAVLLGALCLLIGLSVVLPEPFTKLGLVLAIAMFALIWIATQNFGGTLLGGATDPNSGPLVILLALIYWPLGPQRALDQSTRGAPLVVAGQDEP